MSQLPAEGLILDVGSCDADYLTEVGRPGRYVHRLDPRDCSGDGKPGLFYHSSLIGNALPASSYDAVLVLSTLEHIGLPCYGQMPFIQGDVLALTEIRRLLKPGGTAIVTVPAGRSKITNWYRQYSPADLRRLFRGWDATIEYWAWNGRSFEPTPESEIERFDYFDRHGPDEGAGAVAGVVACRPWPDSVVGVVTNPERRPT
ncbi:MAG TPA: DUF268 domain-containing protein [Chloroflexota bacterium]|nr:DUF268 domain-containing protein [Chloroflexota bacterium]